MKKKHILICVLCAALAIALAVFIWNELQKEPLDLKMYGAEITADGTVIQETEFQLKGYIKQFPEGKRSSTMYFEPIHFQNISDIIISMESYQPKEIPVYLINFDANNYQAHTFVYNSATDLSDHFSLHLSGEKCCCVIQVDNRYFVGSIEPDTPIADILGHFLGLDLPLDA